MFSSNHRFIVLLTDFKQNLESDYLLFIYQAKASFLCELLDMNKCGKVLINIMQTVLAHISKDFKQKHLIISYNESIFQKTRIMLQKGFILELL